MSIVFDKKSDLLAFIGTALNKRPDQIRGIAERSVKSAMLPLIPVDWNARYEDSIPSNIISTREPVKRTVELLRDSTEMRRGRFRDLSASATGGTLTFLNESLRFGEGEQVSLEPERLADRSLHWKLKCWGFEHLRWTLLGFESLPADHLHVHRRWLDEWVEGHPIAAEPGFLRSEWMPHSVSLRILNWSRYAAAFEDQLSAEFHTDIEQFVFKNASFLSDNVEYGVGGNHLVENAIALVIAGVYLDVHTWWRRGRALFQRAARTQFFEDGGHFERSPMYHAIVCQRFASAHSLLESISEESGEVSEQAREAAQFLGHLRPPDGRIPLFNDAVFDEALRIDECLAYAKSVGLLDESTEMATIGPDDMEETGYFWLGSGSDRMLVAAHDIAVASVPAHAHAHPGQVCLWIDGKRVLTDSGVFEYEAGHYRERSRSVRSHNTIQIDDSEPAHMASSFWLWGQLDPTVSADRSGRSIEFEYTVEGFARPNYHHYRLIEREDASWRITDQVDTNTEQIVSRLHVHPQFQAQWTGDAVDVVDQTGEVLLHIVPFGIESQSITEAPFFPRFGEAIDRDVIVLRSSTGQGTFGAELLARPDRSQEVRGQDRNHSEGD